VHEAVGDLALQAALERPELALIVDSGRLFDLLPGQADVAPQGAI